MSPTTRRRGRGGRGGHEPRTRILARAQRAVSLAIQGWTQHAIARDLGVSQAAVSKILGRADARMLAELRDHVERQKVRQTQCLQHLYRESLAAWEASKGEATRRRQRKTESAAGGSGGSRVAEVTIETHHGDPRYLEESRKALGDLRALWGLNAPQRVDLRAGHVSLDHLSDAELVERLAQQDARLRQAGVALAPALSPHEEAK